MYVLNTDPGGYFGSRLMGNIREEKGYTYNIYSTLDAMRFDGCFYVGTEVGNEFAGRHPPADLLRNGSTATGTGRRRRARHGPQLLMGNFLTMLDYLPTYRKSSEPDDRRLAHFIFETIPVKLFAILPPTNCKQLAQRYLRREDMWEVVAGFKRMAAYLFGKSYAKTPDKFTNSPAPHLYLY